MSRRAGRSAGGPGPAAAWRLAAAVALAAALLASAAALRAQEPTGAGAPLEDPPMARAPQQFRVALTGGALAWGEEPGRASLEDGAILGLDLERRVGPFVAFRASGGYGRSRAVNDTASVELNQFVGDVMASLRLGFERLRRVGVVPFGTVGLATVVHDPVSDELVTKSQSAVAFGGGLDADLAGPFGFRAEWRRYVVDSEDLFDPAERTGRGRVADRFYGAVYWRL